MARRLTNNFDLELPYMDECCEALKQRKEIVKCPRCQEKYCCEGCFEKAEQKYHKVLCLGSDRRNAEHPINKLEEAWKKIHYPPETASIMLILKMLAMITQSVSPRLMMVEFNQFHSNIR